MDIILYSIFFSPLAKLMIRRSPRRGKVLSESFRRRPTFWQRDEISHAPSAGARWRHRSCDECSGGESVLTISAVLTLPLNNRFVFRQVVMLGARKSCTWIFYYVPVFFFSVKNTIIMRYKGNYAIFRVERYRGTSKLSVHFV